MTPRLVFRPEAETELLDARAWYEEERLLQNPLAYPRVKGETRRAVVRRFPYAVYFRPIGDEIIVLAVMHGRRLPRRWQSRR